MRPEMRDLDFEEKFPSFSEQSESIEDHELTAMCTVIFI